MATSDRAALAPYLEPVTLSPRLVLERPGQPIEHVYFPDSGIGFVVTEGIGKVRMEAGMFGREGMSGLAIVHGIDRSPHETIVQVAGLPYAWRRGV